MEKNIPILRFDRNLNHIFQVQGRSNNFLHIEKPLYIQRFFRLLTDHYLFIF